VGGEGRCVSAGARHLLLRDGSLPVMAETR
jgi:hypothetical protein